MTYRRTVYDNYMKIKNSEKQRRKLGRCSIYKILDTDALDTQEKIAYIRHNYTYYDGFMDMFNDPETHQHNKNHAVLNDIIRMVLYKRADPSLFKEANVCMM